MKRLSSIALAVALLAAAAPAQVLSDNDLVFTTENGIFSLNFSNSRLNTITTQGGSRKFNAVMIDRGNRGLVSVLSPIIGNSFMVHVQTSGSYTTVTPVPGVAASLSMDQDGQYLVGTTSGGLYKTSGISSTSSLQTLHASVRANALCRDDDTGDHIAAGFLIGPGGFLMRVRPSGFATTIASGLPSLVGIDHDQRTGDIVAVSRDHLMRFDSSGSLLTSTRVSNANCVVVDDVRGWIYVGGGGYASMYRPDLSRRALISVASAGNDITGVAIWGSRRLASPTSNSAKGGTFYRVEGAFNDSPNRTYVCGIGLAGMRPGINLDGLHFININPDRLFFISASETIPLFTRRFIGVTNAIGQFSADFLLPKVSSAMPPVTFVAAVVNTNAPNSLDVAPAHTVKILP